ncbi:hypothetical protein CR105_03615 [Massilia eurypsychrophila]|uniref:Preprotein translocase subunit YajC n=1 Tax=Massilia eurypsychrophila TaxID=1485217 RepID=A0A2G8TJF7_9BURK|nr:PP0621 family protein [Massilia eurypsychrophila]PIL46186.1 hypothetical protein CR105_03615 [Massilia eurypsychrophila]
MMRFLFWVALAILVIWAIRSKIRSAGLTPPKAPSPPPAIETMTSCAHCGVHFPQSEAVRADGLDYCSPAHVRLPAK